ncbi:MAG: isochorismatase family protein [Anaerolineales bacterium]|nr:isochorismatase family protein [Anaerolineales bacterium]
MCATIFRMKEQYFSPVTINDLSRQWLKAYSWPKRTESQLFDIERAALLILDMQGYFLNPDSHAYIPSAKAIVPGLNQVAAYFRSKKRPVIATKHINTVENAGMMGSWWSELITDNHSLSDIHPDLGIIRSEILSKSQYDAFYQSELATVLNTSRIDQLVIGGVMTHLCCETTARAAFVRGFEVFFLVDGTATYNREYHQASLQNLAHGFAVLTTIEDLQKEPRS